MTKSNAESSGRQSNAVVRYFREARGEIAKVTWPTREESWRLTLIVLAATLVFSAFLWVFDTAFSTGVQSLLDLIVG